MIVAQVLDGPVQLIAEAKEDQGMALCQLQINHMVEPLVLHTEYLHLKLHLYLRKLGLLYLFLLIQHLHCPAAPHVALGEGRVGTLYAVVGVFLEG